MESLQGLKSRLGAVKNVGTITKAMEVVSATKMRKSQEVALRTRPYAIEALDMLRKITKYVANGDKGGPTATWRSDRQVSRQVKKTLLVLVASDRGLAGSLNAQVWGASDKFLEVQPTKPSDVQEDVGRPSIAVLAIGKKAQRWALKNNLEIAGEFSGFDDVVDFDEVLHVANTVLEGFDTGNWDRVVTISTHFRTALKQEVLMREILPTNPEKIEETINELVPERGRYAEIKDVVRPLGRPTSKTDEIAYLLEPSAEAIIDELVPYLIRMQMYHLILEANASEHSARRVAMKTACDNADELAGNLTLFYNKARQAAITKEIIEISGTQNALEAA